MNLSEDAVTICPICNSKMQDRHRRMPPMMGRPGCEIIEYRWFCNGQENDITHRLEISAYPENKDASK